MSSSKYIFNLDLHSSVSQISLPCTVGDTDRTLVISFSDGGMPYEIPADVTAAVSIKRPPDLPDVYTLGKVEDSCVIYKFEGGLIGAKGIYNCQVELFKTQGEVKKRIASPRFILEASARVVNADEVIPPYESDNALEMILASEGERKLAEEAREEVIEGIIQMRDSGAFNGKDGKDGRDGEVGPIGPQGPQGPQGKAGEGFKISKTFSSVSQMLLGHATDGVPVGGFVLIATDVENADNAKLYVKTESTYTYLTDLSGSQGIKGESGKDGHTPVLGVDYFTEADKANFVNDVLEALPQAEGVSV
jgi:hypothetical protein